MPADPDHLLAEVEKEIVMPWTLIQPIDSTTYTLGVNTTKQPPVVILDGGRSDDTLWDVIPYPDAPGFVWIGNKATQLALTGRGEGNQVALAKFEPGQEIQRWYTKQVGDGVYGPNLLIVNNFYELVLDVTASRFHQGTHIILYPQNEQTTGNQQFNIRLP